MTTVTMSASHRDYLERCENVARALHHLAASGHGPTFTQRSVAIGQRAAMGTGENFDDFCAAILALEKTA